MFIKCKINNINIFVPSNSTVLEACLSLGVDLPRFCYHHRLSVAGNCRMCLVEIEKAPKPLASCALPVANNMSIFIDTPMVQKARENVIEALLLYHPLDCPICDQGGECDLQDQSRMFGSSLSRVISNRREVEDKECGPVIKTIMTRCIHCTRCVRYASEVAGAHTFGTLNRGHNTEIGFYSDTMFDSEVSGNVIELCPVGALTSKAYAFRVRPWDLQTVEGIDFLDAFGSNLFVDIYQSSVYRITPRLCEDLNQEWLNDKIRFSFDSINNFRLRQLYLKNNTFKSLKKCDPGDSLFEALSFPFTSLSIVFFFFLIFVLNMSLLIRSFFAYSFYPFFYDWYFHLWFRANLLLSSFYLLFFKEESTNFSSFFNTFFSRVSTKNVLFLVDNNFVDHHSLELLKLWEHKLSNVRLRSIESSIKNLEYFHHGDYMYTFSCLESSNSCVFLGFNPKLECSIMNLRLRSRYLSGDFTSLTFSGFCENTLMSNFLTASSLFAFIFLKGKNTVAKSLTAAGRLCFLAGSSFLRLYTLDHLKKLCGPYFLNSYFFFVPLKSGTLTSVFLGIQGLRSSDFMWSEDVVCLNIDSGYKLNKTFFDNNIISTIDFSFFTLEEADKSSFIFNEFGVNLFSRNSVWGHFQGDSFSAKVSSMFFPLSLAIEDDLLIFNFEGRLQKSFKPYTVSSANEVYGDLVLINENHKLKSFKSFAKKEGHTRKFLKSLLNSFYQCDNDLGISSTASLSFFNSFSFKYDFLLKFSFADFREGKSFFTTNPSIKFSDSPIVLNKKLFKSSISNFYLSDSFTRNSSFMQNCSYNYNNVRSNFTNIIY